MLKHKEIRNCLIVVVLATLITAFVCGYFYFNTNDYELRIVILVLGLVAVLVIGSLMCAYTVLQIFKKQG